MAAPAAHGHVVDTAGKLTAADIQYLDAKLDGYRRQSGFAIVAFVVGSLEGQVIDDVAYTAFNTWKIGDAGKDNGVLLVIAPNERKVRIETGKGVGGALTDLQSNDIIRQVISPRLKAEQYREAVDQGSGAIAKALSGEAPDWPKAASARARRRAEADPGDPAGHRAPGGDFPRHRLADVPGRSLLADLLRARRRRWRRLGAVWATRAAVAARAAVDSSDEY